MTLPGSMLDESQADWVEPRRVDAALARALEGHVGLPRPVCELLARRGFVPDDAVRRFLRPRLTDLHPPGDLPDLGAAADRIERAIHAGETVLVHGDYDADGMTATALLCAALRDLGGRPTAFVPHRSRDGYDLGPAGIERAVSEGATLIITADCGISATAAIAEARAHGVDVIVTDHHRPGLVLPDAIAVVNPNRADHAYPFRDLAGVGVAFKLVQEMYAKKGIEVGRLNQHLDLVALGTIADQAPLVGENRTLARFGLRVLDRSRKPGIRALCRAAGVGRWSAVRADDVAFRLAPRLNSAGRMADAREGLGLLMAEDDARADALAQRIDAHNEARRETDRALLEQVRERLAAEYDPERDHAVVLWGDGWHRGVLGIVASRLVDELRRPVALIGMEGDVGRGSARSIAGFHLFRALESCADELERFGGHAAAAGFDIRRERLERFRAGLVARAGRDLAGRASRPEIEVDQALGVDQITPAVVRAITYLEPFGAANPTPRFLASGVRVRDYEPLGEGGLHARFWIEGEAERIEGIAFGMGPEVDRLRAAGRLDAVFELLVEAGPRGLRPQARVLALRVAS